MLLFSICWPAVFIYPSTNTHLSSTKTLKFSYFHRFLNTFYVWVIISHCFNTFCFDNLIFTKSFRVIIVIIIIFTRHKFQKEYFKRLGLGEKVGLSPRCKLSSNTGFIPYLAGFHCSFLNGLTFIKY